MKQLTAWVQDRPGMVGKVASTLGAKKVNILALRPSSSAAGERCGLIVDKPAAAKKVFQQNGWETTEEEVVS